MTVKPPVKQARIGGQASKGQSSGDGPILPHQDARSRRKKRAQQQHQKVEVEHSR